jgi:hypothetical protein
LSLKKVTVNVPFRGKAPAVPINLALRRNYFESIKAANMKLDENDVLMQNKHAGTIVMYGLHFRSKQQPLAEVN